jgi:hypothetical protein
MCDHDGRYKGAVLSADCGDIVSLEGGCVYNIRTDPHEVSHASLPSHPLSPLPCLPLDLRTGLIWLQG